MSFKFKVMDGSTHFETLTDPEEIFDALPEKDARYGYLRSVQSDVLKDVAKRINARDLVIKMNTGSGKTIVGLLTLKALLHQGNRPAVYIAPDNYLVNQVRLEAKALGIKTTDQAESAEFQSGSAILVATLQKVINGKSVFGVNESKIPIGSVLVDDAHACLATTEEQFTLRIIRSNPAWTAIYSLVRDDLAAQSLDYVTDIENQEPTRAMLVPFWTWQRHIEAIRTILVKEAKKETKSDEMTFRWPLLKGDLEIAECTFNHACLEIVTRCIPIERIPSFAEAPHRIFMTATLADDSILVRDFAVTPAAVEHPITPLRASDLGDRLILVPQSQGQAFTEENLKTLAAKLAEQHNVVVLVPSSYRARFWNDVAAETLTAINLSAGVDRLRNGHVGLVVMVNKYDGVDLPDDACRVLVVDDLPDPRSQFDEIEQAALRGGKSLLARQMQRLEQGMGRAIRSRDDFCAVLLTGTRLTKNLYQGGAEAFLTPATKTQLHLGRKIEQQLQSTADIEAAITQFISRDPNWVQGSKAALAGIKYAIQGDLDPVALAERSAFESASRKDYRAAANAIQSVIRTTDDLHLKGWLKQQLAGWTCFFDQAAAQQILLSANSDNRHVLKPMSGIVYTTLQPLLETQAHRCIRYIRKNFIDLNTMVIHVNALVDQLRFKPESSRQFEDGMREVAWLVGLSSDCPETESGSGPDVLWSLGGTQFAVIECKNEATTTEITKHYANQLSGSMHWFDAQYPNATATPVLVFPRHRSGHAVSPHPDTRVITEETLTRLREHLIQFVQSINTPDGLEDPSRINLLLSTLNLDASKIIERHSVAAR